MKVLYAFLADAAVAHPDGKFSAIGGGIGALTGPEFPLQHPQLALLIRLEFTPLECGRTHTVEVHALDSDGQPFAPSLQVQTKPERNPSVPTDPVAVQLVLNMQNLQVVKPGRYAFSVVVDGEEKVSVPLQVSQSSRLS